MIPRDLISEAKWAPLQELKLVSFHELAIVNKLAKGLSASLIVRPFFKDHFLPSLHDKLSYVSARWNKRSVKEFMKVRAIRVRSTKESLASTTPASFFTLAGSWKLASRGWPSIPGGGPLLRGPHLSSVISPWLHVMLCGWTTPTGTIVRAWTIPTGTIHTTRAISPGQIPSR